MEELICLSKPGTMLLDDTGSEVRILLRDDHWPAEEEYLTAAICAGLSVARGIPIIPLVAQVWGTTTTYYGLLVGPHSDYDKALIRLAGQERVLVSCWGDQHRPEREVTVEVDPSVGLAAQAANVFPSITDSQWWEGVARWQQQYESFEEVWTELVVEEGP